MADKADTSIFVRSLEDSAIEIRVLTTIALTMFEQSESPGSDREERELREALQWSLVQIKARSRGWHDLMVRSALSVGRAAPH